MTTRPNHALQRTRHGVAVCSSRVPCAGSLSLGRYPMNEDIPTTWLTNWTTDMGWLPTVGVARRGSRILLRPSRSIYVVSALALVAGVTLCLVDVGLLWVFGPPVIVGAVIAPVAAPVLHRAFGTGFAVDLAERTVRMTRRSNERLLPIDRIVAMQQLDSPCRGSGQINLVFLDDDGRIDRTCIYAHAIGYYVRRIARKLAQHVPWPIIGPDGQPLG